MEYGQFCSIAKATELLGEKWTILIVRELLMGGSRFSELQQGLGLISPTILSRRLESLVECGLAVKKRLPGRRHFQYLPTQSCLELQPIIRDLGFWGQRWALQNLKDKDYDVELLMLYLKRCVLPEKFTGKQTVLQFHFTDVRRYADWWLIVKRDHVDLCVDDPGKEVDVWLTSTVKTLANVWMGKETYKQAVRNGDLDVVGDKALTRNVSDWMSSNMAAVLPIISG